MNMKIIEALNASDVDCAEYVNENGIAWNIDGAGDGWYVTSGVDGMPVSSTEHFDSRDQAIASLPAGVAETDKWEAVESD